MTAAHWELLNQLLTLLQPFEQLTKVVRLKFSCVSDVIPHVVILKKYYNKKTTLELVPRIYNVEISIEHSLSSSFAHLMKNQNFVLATLLDPRFKMNYFTGQVQIEKAKQYLLLESFIMNECSSSSDSDEGTESRLKKNRTEEMEQSSTSSFWDCFNELVTENVSQRNNEKIKPQKN